MAQRARVRRVLEEWQQFLYEEPVQLEAGLQKRYRIYHASFHDFIAEKEEVADERVSRKGANEKIATQLWAGLFGNVPAFDQEQLAHKRELLRIKRRRLQELELGRARKGQDTEPHILVEIEDLGREVADLELLLGDAEKDSTSR